jgi:hypothetical protein
MKGGHALRVLALFAAVFAIRTVGLHLAVAAIVGALVRIHRCLPKRVTVAAGDKFTSSRNDSVTRRDRYPIRNRIAGIHDEALVL